MKFFFLLTFLFVFVFSIFVFQADYSLAQVDLQDQITQQYEAGAGAAELGEARDPRRIVATIIKVFLGLLGTIFMVLVFMGGYWLLIARGDEEKIKKAQNTIKRAVIGLIIIMLSYAIVDYIAKGLQTAVYGG
ncbi:MAG: hypothetical protein GF349_02575 [Candidatus Magasanikbacteria bacterium]|nr:hypothetical protein [Candidatus Magasanikbacteria bacterium]